MSGSQFETALQYHQSGRLEEAESVYGQILASQPTHVDALHGLGVVCLQSGRPAEAVKLLERAVGLRPGSMAFQSNLGMAYQALRQFDRSQDAFQRAIELAPGVAGLYFNLAHSLKEQGRLTEAISNYRKSLELQPGNSTTYNNLGNCYKELGKLDEARELLARAVGLKPDYAEAYLNLGSVLTSMGRPVEGEACCTEAIRLQPKLSAAHNNLGVALKAQDRKADAALAFRHAIKLAPALASALENLGILLKELGPLADSVECFRRAVEAAPLRPESWRCLGNGLMIQGAQAEADACYGRAIELKPDDSSAWSEWLFWQLYRPEVSLPSIQERHRQWSASVTKEACSVPLNPVVQPVERPIRVGFLSADFGQHPIGMFTIRTLEALPALGFEVVCYSTSFRKSAMNDRFRACSVLYRDVQHLLDSDLAALIRADQIDVLIDLAGHTGGNRLPVFAWHPAPIQATWIGSEGTTGLKAIDYLIADPRLVPETADPFYSERVVRLPGSYVSWDPPAAAPAVAPCPAVSRGSVTFGSFNNPGKYHRELIEVWSRILHGVPGSRLLLQYRHLNDPTLRENLLRYFRANQISDSRIEFRDWQPYAEFLANYQELDVALDPFPFGGGATTCEALYMGVPVVTYPGQTFASRHSCSYLSTIGLSEWIANDVDDYVRIAVSRVQDLPALQSLRSGLRDRVRNSPLCDGKHHAKQFAALLRGMISGEFPRSNGPN